MERQGVTPRKPAAAGFTIIEVLIVLAVAGLIFLLIFQAIPTLQRNSRNSQRKEDVATVLHAVSRFGLNNSAQFPANCTDLNCAALKLYQYTASTDIHFFSSDGPSQLPPPAPAIDAIELHPYYRCSNGGASSVGAGSRDIVALYAVETGSGSATKQCQQL